MINILAYKLFESTSGHHSNWIEFLAEIKKSPYKNILDSWFTFIPRRTGRVSISGGSLPSKAWFEKMENGNWYYIYSGAGHYYGRQEGDIQDLFGRLIKDSTKKGSPTYLNRKDLDNALSDDNWFFSNIDPDKQLIYQRIKNRLISDSGIVDDFTVLKFPLLDKLQETGLIMIKPAGELGIIQVELIHNYKLAESYNLNLAYWEFFYKILGKPLDHRIFIPKYRKIIFYPKGQGVKIKTSLGEDWVKCYIGHKNSEDVIKSVQDVVKKYMIKNELQYNENWADPNKSSVESIELVKSLYKLLFESIFNENPSKVNDILDNYFKNNPTDLYLFNSLPDVKSGILKRTGIRDLSLAGSVINRNFL